MGHLLCVRHDCKNFTDITTLFTNMAFPLSDMLL